LRFSPGVVAKQLSAFPRTQKQTWQIGATLNWQRRLLQLLPLSPTILEDVAINAAGAGIPNEVTQALQTVSQNAGR